MKVISSWFDTHGPGEQGEYAQVKGDVASEKFRDVYWRCTAVFFTTARSAEPEARLVLFSNVEWDVHASRVAAEVRTLLQLLGVEVIAFSGRMLAEVRSLADSASSGPVRSTLDATAMAPHLGVPRNTVKRWTSDVLYPGYNTVRGAL